jgi:hypothetical protein
MKIPNSDQGGKIKDLQKRLDKISSVNLVQDEKSNNKDTCQGKINISVEITTCSLLCCC